jgi:hypothetical protein
MMESERERPRQTARRETFLKWRDGGDMEREGMMREKERDGEADLVV